MVIVIINIILNVNLMLSFALDL